MIDELFIYGRKDSVFKNIVAQIDDIKTYHVSPNYGYDLNTTNLQTFIKDTKYGLVDVEKYPICVCITPRSIPVKINSYRWEQFTFSVFFLERTGYLNGNEVRDKDKETQLSQDENEDNWSRMKNAAMQFIDLLDLTLKGDATVDGNTVRFRTIVNLSPDKVSIRRLSNFGVDKISGVELSFQALLATDQCLVISNPIDYTVTKFEEEKDPIWVAERGNYYTKPQSDERYIQEETDPIWIAQKSDYQTTAQADAKYLQSETDPVWLAQKTNYFTKTEADARYLQSYNEIDPIWLADKPNYYNKTQADARYLQSFTEQDPIWLTDKPNYYTKTEANDTFLQNEVDPVWNNEKGNYYTKLQADGRYLQSETDPIWLAQKVNYYNKTEADSRYLQTETDPVWLAEKSDYYTKTQADARYLQNINGIVAGGDLSGTYPNPSVNWANGFTTYDTRYASSTGALSGSGAASRIAFWNGATSLSSNANLNWDNVNSRLGIGTNTPSSFLHIFGTTEQLRLSYDATNFTTFTVDSTGLLTIRNDTSGNPVLVLGTGIGNTEVLNVGGNILLGANRGILRDNTSTTNFGFVNNQTSQIQFRSLGNQAILIDNANVRIGAGTPVAKLDVLSTTEQLRLGYDAANYASYTVDSTGNLSVSLTGTTPKVSFTNQISIVGGIQVPNVTAIQFLNSSGTYNGTRIYENSSNGLRIEAESTIVNRLLGTTSAFAYDVWDNSNNVLFRVRGDGTIGVGTLTPNAKVEIVNQGEALRLSYDATHFTSINISATGNPTITPGGGIMNVNGAFYLGTNNVNSNFYASGTSDNTGVSIINYQIGGATTTTFRVGMRGTGTATPGAGFSSAGLLIGSQAISLASSGTHPIFAQQAIKPLTISGAGATVTNSATLYLEDAATGATNNYNLWAAGTGVNRFDGTVITNNINPQTDSLSSIGQAGSIYANVYALNFRSTIGITLRAGAASNLISFYQGSNVVGQFTQNTNNFLINSTTDAGSKLYVVATYEQARLAYDATNYMSFTVASNGSVTLNLNGTSPEFIFSKKLKANATYRDIINDTDGTTVTFDMSASNIHKVTLGGNRTLAVANVSVGQVFQIDLIQDGTGGRTVTWFSGISWPNGIVPTLTLTAGKTDSFIFKCTGIGTYQGFPIGFNL